MRYHLSEGAVLKMLETPSVYVASKDELYELDHEGFEFLRKCSSPGGAEVRGEEGEFADYCLSEGIITTSPVSVRRLPVSQSPVPSLRYLELQITDRCNLRCRHCYIGKPQNNELTIPGIRKILDEFEEMQGLRLLITGGEPLIHSRFPELNSLLQDYGFRKILFTNGLLLSEEMVRGLQVDEIQFSVDGLEHGHEGLRGKGTYRIVMRRMEEAMRAGKEVSVATMVHRENLGEFEEMGVLFRGMGVRDWTVDVPCSAGNMAENPFLHLSPEAGGRYLNYGFGDGLHGGGEGFACGHHLLSVLANGSIAKCAFYSHAPLGTTGEGLLKAWMRMPHTRLEELECHELRCPHIDACRGGCRYRASISGGESVISRKRDLYKCFACDIMEKQGQVASE